MVDLSERQKQLIADAVEFLTGAVPTGRGVNADFEEAISIMRTIPGERDLPTGTEEAKFRMRMAHTEEISKLGELLDGVFDWPGPTSTGMIGAQLARLLNALFFGPTPGSQETVDSARALLREARKEGVPQADLARVNSRLDAESGGSELSRPSHRPGGGLSLAGGASSRGSGRPLPTGEAAATTEMIQQLLSRMDSLSAEVGRLSQAAPHAEGKGSRSKGGTTEKTPSDAHFPTYVKDVLPMYGSFMAWAQARVSSTEFNRFKGLGKLRARHLMGICRTIDIAARRHRDEAIAAGKLHESMKDDPRVGKQFYELMIAHAEWEELAVELTVIQVEQSNADNKGQVVADAIAGPSRRGTMLVPTTVYQNALTLTKRGDGKRANERAGLNADGTGLQE